MDAAAISCRCGGVVIAAEARLSEFTRNIGLSGRVFAVLVG
jgi:hypothetical protein